MALDAKKREMQRQKIAEEKAKKEQEELAELERERKRAFKERRLLTAQHEGKKKSKAMKVRSLRKFMEDQIEHEAKRHEKLTNIIV